MCTAMDTDWSAWQSAKVGKIVYGISGLGELKKE